MEESLRSFLWEQTAVNPEQNPFHHFRGQLRTQKRLQVKDGDGRAMQHAGWDEDAIRCDDGLADTLRGVQQKLPVTVHEVDTGKLL